MHAYGVSILRSYRKWTWAELFEMNGKEVKLGSNFAVDNESRFFFFDAY
jgi:hypothetical protein